MKLNNRQVELLAYLKANSDRYVSKKQICRDLPYAYPRHLENNNTEGNKSVAFSNISQDVRALNQSDMDQIVVCNHYGYKLANEEEADRYIASRFKRDLKALKLDYQLSKKVGRNHQLYFTDSDIKEIRTFVEV